MSENEIRVLYVQPGKYPEERTIPNTLRALQELVGGDIECCRPWRDSVCVICNDSGKIDGLPPNRLYGHADFLAGSFVVCGNGGEDFISLTDTHIKRYIDQGIPPICHCLPVSLNQHWVVPFKYTNGSGWDSNRDRFSNQCHRTDTNWQVNATKRACLSGRGYCPNAVHQPAGSLYTVQHNNGFPCAAYRYFDPSQQGQL